MTLPKKPLPPGECFSAYVRLQAGDWETDAEFERLYAAAFPALHGAFDTLEADRLAVELRRKLADCGCAVCQL